MNAEITEGNKVGILLTMPATATALSRRIRDRVYSFAIWTLGAFLRVTGPVLEGWLRPSASARSFLLLVVLPALGAVVFYVRTLRRGFRNQFRVAIRIDTLLEFYEHGMYDREGELYPAGRAPARVTPSLRGVDSKPRPDLILDSGECADCGR